MVFPIKQYHGILSAMLKMAGKFVRGKCDTAKKIPSRCYFDNNIYIVADYRNGSKCVNIQISKYLGRLSLS